MIIGHTYLCPCETCSRHYPGPWDFNNVNVYSNGFSKIDLAEKRSICEHTHRQQYDHTISTCDLALASGSIRLWNKLARSALYHSDILSMYPSRFGLTLRQACHLAVLVRFNRSSVIVSTKLKRSLLHGSEPTSRGVPINYSTTCRVPKCQKWGRSNLKS